MTGAPPSDFGAAQEILKDSSSIASTVKSSGGPGGLTGASATKQLPYFNIKMDY